MSVYSDLVEGLLEGTWPKRLNWPMVDMWQRGAYRIRQVMDFEALWERPYPDILTLAQEAKVYAESGTWRREEEVITPGNKLRVYEIRTTSLGPPERYTLANLGRLSDGALRESAMMEAWALYAKARGAGASTAAWGSGKSTTHSAASATARALAAARAAAAERAAVAAERAAATKASNDPITREPDAPRSSPFVWVAVTLVAMGYLLTRKD